MTKRGKKREARITPKKGREPIYVQIFEGGRRYETCSSVKMELRKPWQKPNPEEIRSVIPGVVLSLFVQEGDVVEKNQDLMVYEAMKMHNVIRAPFAGVVKQILVNSGDKLPKGALMLIIRAAEPPVPDESVPEEHYLEELI